MKLPEKRPYIIQIAVDQEPKLITEATITYWMTYDDGTQDRGVSGTMSTLDEAIGAIETAWGVWAWETAMVFDFKAKMKLYLLTPVWKNKE